MPLTSIPGDQAFANLRSNRNSVWPDGRKDRVRLNGVAQVSFQPEFRLVPGEAVFTVGSCFARNIEQRLAELGFRLPAREFVLPAEERASETENDFLNKFAPHSILNEFRWALDPAAAYPDRGLLELEPGVWHDPHSAVNVQPAPLERVLERREMVSALYRQIPQCRILVMTLGLVEAWFDEETGLYLNGAPPPLAMRAAPDRFRLDVLTVDEVCEVLRQIYDLLVRFGHPEFRMLLTVSPVPMRNTFTGKDAITANSYSKSALRAAAEIFVSESPRVDYFPSYETVVHTLRTSAYIQDNRHVTPQVVREIVDRVVEAYCPEVMPEAGGAVFGARRSAREIEKAIKARDYPRATRLFTSLDEKNRFQRAGFDEFTYRYNFGCALMRTGAFAQAQVQLSMAASANPDSAETAHQLGRALARLQRPLDAEAVLRKAVALAPEAAEIRLTYARALIEVGKPDLAEAELLMALRLSPRDARVEALLASLRGDMARATPSARRPLFASRP